MIEDEGKYYLYRHIRLDKNEVFYVGIGTKKLISTGKFKDEYNRAFDRSKRSAFWKRIIDKTDYKVEIILESNSRGFTEEKEKEFIALYGRINLGTGILCNLTNGGENRPINTKSKNSYKVYSKILDKYFNSICDTALFLNKSRYHIIHNMYHLDTYQLSFLDNTKEEERLKCLFEFRMNMRKRCTKNKLKSTTSKYIGVSWHKGNKKWRASVFDSKLKRNIDLGYFKYEEDASLAYQTYILNLKESIKTNNCSG